MWLSGGRGARNIGWMLALALMGVAALQAFAYWPGLMTWDSVRQYGQALSGDFDDWHPPVMAWVWRQLLPISTGPAPMLVLQLLLYWTGFGLIVGWAMQRGRGGLALAFAGISVAPLSLALMGAVLKDCLMAGALMTAIGLLAWSDADRGWPMRIVAMLLVLFTASLRFNAFLAGVPLVVALLPERWRHRPVRFCVAVAIAAAMLVAAMPVANRLLQARSSGVELSLVIFDMGGITERAGIDAFPPLPVKDPVAANHACYRPVKWDSYSFWVDPLCPVGFDPVRSSFTGLHASPYRWWLGAIMSHPIAYALHRIDHFNINARFLVHDEVERPVQDQSAPNDWHYSERPNLALRLIDRIAVLSAHSPLGWPIWWMAVAFAAVFLAPALPSRRLILPIALSSLLYGLGYLVFSVASELRYHLWTIIAAAVAAAIVGSDLAGGVRPSRRSLFAALAPLGIVTLLCLVSRLVRLG